MNQRKTLAALAATLGSVIVTVFGVMAVSGLARASDGKSAESRSFQSAVTTDMLQCSEDAQCIVVQGWCTTFAINRARQAAYDAIPNDADGKGARNCPPGWLPPLPKAVCETKRCKLVSGHPEH